jgi:hypothetical protein
MGWCEPGEPQPMRPPCFSIMARRISQGRMASARRAPAFAPLCSTARKSPSFPRKRESSSFPSDRRAANSKNAALCAGRHALDSRFRGNDGGYGVGEGSGEPDFRTQSEKTTAATPYDSRFSREPLHSRGRLGLRRFAPEVTLWIPACAGMTAGMESAKAAANRISARQGNDEGGGHAWVGEPQHFGVTVDRLHWGGQSESSCFGGDAPRGFVGGRLAFPSDDPILAAFRAGSEWRRAECPRSIFRAASGQSSRASLDLANGGFLAK